MTANHKDLGWKLRSNVEEPWSSTDLVTVLSENSLQEMKLRFSYLDSSVKLRILFSFLELSKKVANELRSGITEIIELALNDDDEWVQVVGDALKDFGEKQFRNLEIEPTHKSFQWALNELRSKLQSNTSSEKLYPKEFAFFEKDLQEKLLKTTSADHKPFQLKETAVESLEARHKRLELLSQKGSEVRTFGAKSGMKAAPARPAASFLREGTQKNLFLPQTPIPPPRPTQRKESKIDIVDIDEVANIVQAQEDAIKRKKESDLEEAEERQRKKKEQAEEAKRQREREKIEKAEKKREEKEREKEREREQKLREKEQASQAKLAEQQELEKKRKEALEEEENAKKRQKKAEEAVASQQPPPPQGQVPFSAPPQGISPALLQNPNTSSSLTAAQISQLRALEAQRAQQQQQQQQMLAAQIQAQIQAQQQQQQQQQQLQQQQLQQQYQQQHRTTPYSQPYTQPLQQQQQQQLQQLQQAQSILPPQLVNNILNLSAAQLQGILTGPSLRSQLNISEEQYNSFLAVCQNRLRQLTSSPATAAQQQQPQAQPPQQPKPQPYSYPPSSMQPQQLHSQQPQLPSHQPQLPSHHMNPQLLHQQQAQLHQPQPPQPQPQQPYSSVSPAQLQSQAALLHSQQLQQQQMMLQRQQQLQQQQQQGVPSYAPYTSAGGNPPSASQYSIDPETERALFQNANALTPADRELITMFLNGDQRQPDPSLGPIVKIVMNQEQKDGEDGKSYVEEIVFEMNYESSQWRKLRRRRPIKP